MSTLSTHSFTLVLEGANCIDDAMEDALYGAFNDALLSSRDGVVRLGFDREACSRSEAIASAIRDVQKAGYRALPTEPYVQDERASSTGSGQPVRMLHSVAGSIVHQCEPLDADDRTPDTTSELQLAYA